MESTSPLNRKPLAVVTGQHAWLTRSIESILSSNGFTAVALADEALHDEQLPELRPDLLVVEADPPETAWAALFDQLRLRRAMTASTPVIAVTAEPLTRDKRIEGLRAGAWDVFGYPLDAEMLTLKARAYIRAKFEVDDARDRGLVDPETDFYNIRGVLRRIYEEASEAARHQRPLACVVAALDRPTSADPNASLAAAHNIRKRGRASDVLGRLGPAEFVVIAPGTDAAGAHRLAERLADLTTNGHNDDTALPPLHAGYAAMMDLNDQTIEPVDLFVRAVIALRSAQATDTGARIRAYD